MQKKKRYFVEKPASTVSSSLVTTHLKVKKYVDASSKYRLPFTLSCSLHT